MPTLVHKTDGKCKIYSFGNKQANLGKLMIVNFVIQFLQPKKYKLLKKKKKRHMMNFHVVFMQKQIPMVLNK